MSFKFTVLFSVMILLLSCSCNREIIVPVESLYASSNLSGHSIAAEQVGTYPVFSSDVSISSVGNDYGVVMANEQQIVTYVNAIGYKKFEESFPGGGNISLSAYKYRYLVKLPIVPTTGGGTQKSQAVHLMLQLWDGRNALWTADKHTLEASIYWQLNPWNSDFGQIQLYVAGVGLWSTGIDVTPDTDWHEFEVGVDFNSKKYSYIKIDSEYLNVSDKGLWSVLQSSWGTEVALTITTESMNCFPSGGEVFWWETYFKNLEFSRLKL